MVRFPDFFISRPVGYGNSNTSDVLRVHRTLDETGHGRSASTPSGVYDSGAIGRIRDFQEDFGLVPDGQLVPGGPTETAMTVALEAKRSGGDDGMEAVRAPFAALGRDGLKFMPDPHNQQTPPVWRDADGNEVPTDRLGRTLAEARRQRRFTPAALPAGATAGDIASPLDGVLGKLFGAAAPHALLPRERQKATVASAPRDSQPEPGATGQDSAGRQRLSHDQGTPPKPTESEPTLQPSAPRKQNLPWVIKDSPVKIPNNPDTDPWPTSPISRRFRFELHKRESSDLNYQSESGDGKALGRYQLRMPALQDAGLIDNQGNWTGKHGVHSRQEFLANPIAQEKALADFLSKTEKQLENNGAKMFEGQRIDGIRSEFTVTADGLIAAAHRGGAKRVKQYLDHLQGRNWISDESNFPPELKGQFLPIETRLREFEGISRKPRM